MDVVIIDDMLREILLYVNKIDLWECRLVNRRWYKFTRAIYNPIMWRGDYKECCRAGDFVSITTGSAVKYYDRSFIVDAAMSGSLPMMRYFGLSILSRVVDRDVLSYVCHSDNYSLIKRLVIIYGFEVDTNVMIQAAQHGNTKVIKFLMKHLSLDARRGSFYLKQSCENGHIRAARLLSCYEDDLQYTLAECCKGGLYRLVKRIGIQRNIEDKVWRSVGEGGSRKILDYLAIFGKINYNELVRGAIIGGHLGIIKEFLPKMTIPINSSHIEDAIYMCKIEILEYLLTFIQPSNTNIRRISSIIYGGTCSPLIDLVFDFLHGYMTERIIKEIGDSAAIADYYPIVMKCHKWCKEYIPNTMYSVVNEWYKVALEKNSYAVIDYLDNVQ